MENAKLVSNKTNNQKENKHTLQRRMISIDAIRGNEILMQDIISDTGVTLMSKGIKLKKEYISHLKELEIFNIYISDELSEGIDIDEMIEEQVKSQCQKIVRDTIEKYFNSGRAELETLKNVAEDIILDVLNQKEVMFNISGVRQKSESIYAHSINVCSLSVLIASKMKLPKNKIKEIAVGSLLHDIGFKYIEDSIENLNYDNMNTSQIKEIRKHVIYGYASVENEEWLSSVAKDIILSHHERIDGSGYPMKVGEEKIKVGSKIVAVCDEFDRMVYGIGMPKMKVYEAIESIVSQGSIRFDMKIVKIFNESVAAYPNGISVITNNGDCGIVLRQNNKCPTRPVIRLLCDKNGKKYNEWIEKDLTKELTLFIADTM